MHTFSVIIIIIMLLALQYWLILHCVNALANVQPNIAKLSKFLKKYLLVLVHGLNWSCIMHWHEYRHYTASVFHRLCIHYSISMQQLQHIHATTCPCFCKSQLESTYMDLPTWVNTLFGCLVRLQDTFSMKSIPCLTKL